MNQKSGTKNSLSSYHIIIFDGATLSTSRFKYLTISFIFLLTEVFFFQKKRISKNAVVCKT